MRLGRFCEGGFKFFTNSNSRKGQEFTAAPNVLVFSICMFVKYELRGFVQRLSDDIFREVFYNGFHNRQLTVLLSNPEQPVSDKDTIIKIRERKSLPNILIHYQYQ